MAKKKTKNLEEVNVPLKQEHKEEPKQEEIKLKRFANHNLAFQYFLKMIGWSILFKDGKLYTTPTSMHRKLPMREQRRWLYQIFQDASMEDLEHPTWDVIDSELRFIVEGTSSLSSHKRKFLMDGVLPWVDNFVAKEGEEITMTEEDLK